jgi:ubiquinone/menaquinone biosynthesis C-methylase UbiE
VAEPGARLWADRTFLREVQYQTDVNLAARQSVYAYQQPPVNLVSRTLDLAGLAGHEVVADIGCGNGLYLAELARRGHAGAVLGVDMSPGMLRAARQRAGNTGRSGRALLTADATALPLRDAATDLTLAMHMLYHVPEPGRAVAELRRVTRPGGRVIVGLNGDDHLQEMRAVVTAALASIGHGPWPRIGELVDLDQGETLLRSVFTSVTRHDFVSKLVLPGPEPVLDYVRSMSEAKYAAAPELLIPAVTDRFPGRSEGGVFEVTTHSGCLVCA